MRIAGQQRPARSAELWSQCPGVAAGQARQIAEQFHSFVGELAADVQPAEQIEIGLVDEWVEKFAHFVVGDAGLNQFEQDPFVFLLADHQAAVTQQIADQQDGLLCPGSRHEAGGPHWQRAARFLQPVVDPFAIGGQFGECVVVELIDFAVEVEKEPSAAKEAVGFEQFVLIGDLLGRPAAGHGPCKEHLGWPVERVQEAQPIQRTAPAGGGDVRHAVFVAGDGNAPSGMFQVEWFHARRESYAWRLRDVRSIAEPNGAGRRLRAFGPAGQTGRQNGVGGFALWAAAPRAKGRSEPYLRDATYSLPPSRS